MTKKDSSEFLDKMHSKLLLPYISSPSSESLFTNVNRYLHLKQN